MPSSVISEFGKDYVFLILGRIEKVQIEPPCEMGDRFKGHVGWWSHGLSVVNLKNRNLVILFKWNWSFITKSESLLV